MILILLLLLPEILSVAVLRQHLFKENRILYNLAIIIHISASICIWVLVLRILNHDSFFDTPDNIANSMALAGLVCAVVLPRYFLAVCHFTGRYLNRKNGGHLRWLTNAALIISILAIFIVGAGTFIGRFNFRYEHHQIVMKGLPPELEGFKIVQVSDLHLSSFYHHKDKLVEVMNAINDLKPDILINTGDFVTFGWREFEGFDTILSAAKGKFGKIAIPGNHDAGRYHPEFTEAEIENNVSRIAYLAGRSGYTMLHDSAIRLNTGTASIAVTGVTTVGRHGHMTHGNIDTARKGIDSVDFEILLTHDPNHWIAEVAGKRRDIDLTLSGHTHGMQLGIMTKKVRWSPVKIYYPHWNGIYRNGDQVQYVNRGLGVLAVPFRIWMPPEISVLTLRGSE